MASHKAGFTLIELLITISIIGIMAGMILFALFSAQEQAKVQKTRALIARLDSIIRTRYESYRTRRAPINFLPTDSPRMRAKMKVDAIRDLMRMEMPDRWTDIIDPPLAPIERPMQIDKISIPAVTLGYRARWSAVTGQIGALSVLPSKVDNQNAECLYMIVMEAVSQEGDARDAFKADAYSDTDNDGFPEFIDAWGKPIQFFRWAPGLVSDQQVVLQTNMSAASNGRSCKVTATVNPQSSKFASQSGYYVGGTLAIVDDGELRGDKMARITGYINDGAGNVTFMCETPSTTMQVPFGTPLGGSYEFAVMMPDPFDYSGAYPLYNPGSMNPPSPDTSIPSFAIYPIVFSGGPDGACGLSNKSDLRYTDFLLNPFCLPDAPSRFNMVGSAIASGSTETGWYRGCTADNIHNHRMDTR